MTAPIHTVSPGRLRLPRFFPLAVAAPGDNKKL
jgi:hypothetical protein